MNALLGQRRAQISVGVLVAIIVVFVAGLGIAVAMLRDKWSQIAEKKAELVSLQKRALEAAKPDPLSASGVLGNPFLEGSTFALAANAFQQRIVSLIESTGGTLVSVGVDPPAPDDQAGRRAVVQVAAEMTIEGLQQILYRLESETPLSFVDTLNIDRQSVRAQSQPQDAPRLRIDLRIAEYFQTGDR